MCEWSLTKSHLRPMRTRARAIGCVRFDIARLRSAVTFLRSEVQSLFSLTSELAGKDLDLLIDNRVETEL